MCITQPTATPELNMHANAAHCCSLAHTVCMLLTERPWSLHMYGTHVTLSPFCTFSIPISSSLLRPEQPLHNRLALTTFDASVGKGHSQFLTGGGNSAGQHPHHWQQCLGALIIAA